MNQAQSLPTPTSSSLYIERLTDFRAEFRKLGLDGYLVPMADEYQNEYVGPSDRRIRFLTGFTGTAGLVIVMIDRAAFFTDSRYTLQAQAQLPEGAYDLYDAANKTPNQWLCETLRPQMKIGFDPRLHTIRQIERYETLALKKGATLVPTEINPVDVLWTDKPDPSLKPVVTHDVAYAGKDSAQKRKEVGEALKKSGVNAAILCDPASIAWLLNVRGDDIPYTPLPCSTAIIRVDGTVEWFVDPRKITPDIEKALDVEVTRYTPNDFIPAVRRLGEAKAKAMIDPDGTSYYIVSLLRQAGVVLTHEEDPCALPRACKNVTEIDGMRAAHRRDGAAMVRLLAWLDQNMTSRTITELEVEEKLAGFRSTGALYKGPSFSTIAGSGPNGAIVHYRATEETNRALEQGSFLLLDSGAQYLDGTTDVTRTIAIGEPTTEMRDRYTRVLKGHIALACARFPEGTNGADLDVLARQYLWNIGLDYGHGTGHGVGSYLCVHEGPQSISRRGTTPLREGMVTSNEPGFYKPRHYGIRLENLQYVIELFELNSPERKMFGFEPLTFVPFDKRALDLNMLTHDEKEWLNAYHARVHKAIRPQLDEATGQWLAQATQPV